LAEQAWYILGEHPWYSLGEYRWYIIVRIVTAAARRPGRRRTATGGLGAPRLPNARPVGPGRSGVMRGEGKFVI